MAKNKYTPSGFTLIELLIVIAIIGILSTLLMANFIGVRQRARDAQRKSDIRQLQAALELYRADTGQYPAGGTTTSLNSTACTTSNAFTYTNASGQTSTYMSLIPCDSLGSTSWFNNGNYYYSSTGSTYVLIACLENSADTDGVTTFNVNGVSNTTVDPSGVCTSTNKGVYFVKTNP